MKKLLIICLALFLFASAACAEEITWHSVFGLSEGATPEELEKMIETVFSAEPSKLDSNMYIPDHKYLYDLPIRWIIKNTYSTEFAPPYVYFEIEFEEESLTAENIAFLYKKLCEEFGSPTYNHLVKNTITVNGEEEILISPVDTDAVQLAIDQFAMEGLICWDNVSLECYDKISSYFKDESKAFTFGVAYNEGSLKREVKLLYRNEKE